jgi:hypothetical protein
MIKKEQCISGTTAIVNNKITKWNDGAKMNGLLCHVFKSGGIFFDDLKELIPNTEIEILGPPKRYLNSGTQVKFKIKGDDRIMAAWWICFKHKIDLI